MADPPSPPEPPSRPPVQRGPAGIPSRLVTAGARGARGVARATGVEGAVEVVAEETIVQAVESEAFERTLARVLQGPAVEESFGRALASPAVERALADALDSEMVDRLWERLLASDEAQKLVERIAEAPEVRAAIAQQGVGFIEDVGRTLREAARRIDDVFEGVVRRLLFRRKRETPSENAGAITRALALAIDAGILNLTFLAASALFTFVANAVVGDGDGASTEAVVAGVGLWLVAGAAYLLTFWTLAGQTPGMRFLRIRLEAQGGGRIGLRQALRRLVGLGLAIIPFGLGLLGVVLNDSRRGWPDRLASTDVAYEDISPDAAPWSEREG